MSLASGARTKQRRDSVYSSAHNLKRDQLCTRYCGVIGRTQSRVPGPHRAILIGLL